MLRAAQGAAPPAPMRLHRSLQESPCGDSAMDCFRIYAEFKAILSSQSRHECSRFPTPLGREGVRGKALFGLPPAAFRRFRRAKAALFPRLRSAIASNRCRTFHFVRPFFRRAKAALCPGFAPRLQAIAVARRAKHDLISTRESVRSSGPGTQTPGGIVSQFRRSGKLDSAAASLANSRGVGYNRGIFF